MATSNEDKTAGVLERMKGKAEKVYGEIADDPHAKAQGERDKLHGSYEKTKGDAKQAVKAKIDGL